MYSADAHIRNVIQTDLFSAKFQIRKASVIVAVGKTLPWIKPSPGFFFKFKTLPGVFPLKTTNWKNPP